MIRRLIWYKGFKKYVWKGIFKYTIYFKDILNYEIFYGFESFEL